MLNGYTQKIAESLLNGSGFIICPFSLKCAYTSTVKYYVPCNT